MQSTCSQPAWQLLVRCQIGLCDWRHVIDWASVELAATTDQSQTFLLFDLMDMKKPEPGQCFVPEPLRQLVEKRNPGFVTNSKQGVAFARSLWSQHMLLYLNREISPSEVCGLAGHLEVVFDYPEWLGNMFNVCDWVDEETHDEVPWIAEEVRRLRSEEEQQS